MSASTGIHLTGSTYVSGSLYVSGSDSLHVIAGEGSPANIYVKADQGDDAGDEWRIQAGTSDTLAIGNDKASAGTYVDIVTITGNSTNTNTEIKLEGSLKVKEKADAIADTAAYGQLWVKNTSPNQLYFTNDDGNDVQITSGASLAGGGGVALDDISGGDAASNLVTSTGGINMTASAGNILINARHAKLNLSSSSGAHITGSAYLTGSLVLSGSTSQLLIKRNIHNTIFDLDASSTKLTIHDDQDTGDKFSITVAQHGATTMATVDDDATAAHLTLDADGDIALSAAGGNVTMDDGTLTIFDFNTADTTLTIHDDQDTGDKFTITVEQHGVTTLSTVDDDSNAGHIKLAPDGKIFLQAGVDVVINEDGDDHDLRVESQNQQQMMRVEASTDRLSICAAGASPAGTVHVKNANDGGVPLLLLENEDTDQIAVDINATNIDANVLDITADALTTGVALNISADALTTGRALQIDDNSSNTGTRQTVLIKQNHASATGATAVKIQSDSNGAVPGLLVQRQAAGTATADGITGILIDLDDTGETGGSNTQTVIGLDTNMETNNGAGTTNAFGHRIVMTGDADGTHTHTGLSINLGQTDTNTHIELLSSADTGDKATIAVGAAGATTLATVDDDGAAAHLTLDADGDIILDVADEQQVLFKNNGTTAVQLQVSASVGGFLSSRLSGSGGITLESKAGMWTFDRSTSTSRDAVLTLMESSGDLNIQPKNTKDLIFIDGGNNEIFRVDSSAKSINLESNNKLQFRDTGIFLYSPANGNLEITADINTKLTGSGAIELHTSTMPASGSGWVAAHNVEPYVAKVNGIIETTLIVDIDDTAIEGATDAAIGKDGQANVWFAKITQAVNGTIFKVMMTCAELPDGSNQDIDLWGNDQQLAHAADVDGSGNRQQIIDRNGNWTLGMSKEQLLDLGGGLNNYYLCLTNGGSSVGTEVTYTQGTFIIKLFGAPPAAS